MMNRHLILCALCALLPLTAAAQTLKEWDDVRVTSLNRQRAHTLDIPVSNAADVAQAYTPTNALEASPYFLTLNGTWKFQWVGTPDRASDTFMQPTFDASAWDDIDVPSSWQVYGLRHGKQWDKPLYVNTRYPFTYDRQTWSVMTERPEWFTYRGDLQNPVGSYRREFTLPREWKGRDIFLRFNGAGHGYYVWVNGQFVGYAEDSYLPSEFNVTDKVRAGVNTIAVRVYRFTSGSFLECQDYWRLTGITRDVYLWSAPRTRIDDFFFRTTALKNANTEAEATLTATISGLQPRKQTTLTAQLLDGERLLAAQSAPITATGDVELRFPTASGIVAWSAEQPRLYDLVLTLKEKDRAVDVRALKVGFRTVGVREDGALLVNGRRIIFHGVDRHSFSENGGRTLTKEEIETDLMQMKRLNVNGIRTSHYPNNPYLYDLCDRLGLYVLAEADVECHGNTHLSHEEAFRPAMVERSVRHVLTLRNHPAIVIWSAGNESGNGPNFKTVMDSIARLDPTRLTHYEGNSQWSSVTSTMYANVDFIERTGRERLQDYQQGRRGIRPHVQCENTHAMGNSMANQREYYDLYERYPALAGEFVWDWKDQGLKVSSRTTDLTFEALGRRGKTDVRSILDPSKGEYWAYGGDFGDQPNDDNFCCNGVVLADNTPTAKSFAMKKIYQPLDFQLKDSTAGVFCLRSKLQQRVLDDLNVSYILLEDGMEIGRGTVADVRLGIGETHDITLPDVQRLVAQPRHPEAEYFIRFSATQKQATEWAEAGHEVAHEQFRLRAATGRQPYQPATAQALTVNASEQQVDISGQGFKLRFQNGLLTAFEAAGQQLLAAPLTFQAFRLPTDNERGRASSYDRLGLRNLTLQPGKFSVQSAKDGQRVQITVTNTYVGAADTRFIVQQDFTVFVDGAVLVNTSMDPSPKGFELPRLGLRTELPAGFEQVRWLGRGPLDSYRDRREATHVGLWHSTVSGEWTNYVKPQEQGNKEDVRWMAVTNAAGQGLFVVAPDGIAASVGHWRPEDLYTTADKRLRHPSDVAFCEQTVLNLDAYNRALGNASCGPDVLDKYKVRSAKTHQAFFLLPLTQPQTDEQLATRARFMSPVSAPATITAHRGTVTITSPDPKAVISYSVNGGKQQTYSAPFQLTDGGTVSATATSAGREPSPVNVESLPRYISKQGWSIVSVSSQQVGNEAVGNVIDEDPATIWHSQYSPQTPDCPHEIIVDMGQECNVEKFVYQGREDMTNGRVNRFEVYFSLQPDSWGTAAATGRLRNSADVQEIDIPGTPLARYFRFVALSTHDRQRYASAAELGIVPAREAATKKKTKARGI